ncbi:ISAs1 family transposase [Mesorhizobium sp.]|uniref:ISAs1 family transposase n=1 Tax=Mesorhizobium sp. TaxID=1871066 RepID=UPI00258E8694|nr:ISAs1 family transposase [Mesorhizobium sp.]
MLAIKGAVVTIDAMGCQRAIARKVLDKKADYIFALEGNQGTLREDVELFAAEQRASNFKDTTVSRARTVDGDHGRIESRDITVIHDIDWLQKNHQWPGLNSVVMVQSTRETGGKIERETRFYITSLVLIASLIGPSSEPIGRSRTASIGCSIWSSEMTNAACEPITLPQTSPQ